MTIEILLVLLILLAALVLFVTEWLRMDLVALLVLSVLAITGLVSPSEAVAGFSNPAVITVWAMFILSEGLTRAGIADLIGDRVVRAAGASEIRMIVIFMLVGGFLSAFMNNIGVAALMLPVVVDVARRAGVAPSRLLMPLAYGTLLGGLMTLIGTPPNLLVSMFMEDSGFEGFAFFDFAWIGLPILLVGTAFVALVGRHLLPRTDITKASGGEDLQALYGLRERIVALRVPEDSLLVGRSIADTALASAGKLMVIALIRQGGTQALPSGRTLIRGGDVLLVQGRLERLRRLRRWSELVIEREAPELQRSLWSQDRFAELVVAEDAWLDGQPLHHQDFRERHGANVLAVRRAGKVRRTQLSEHTVAAGDRLLVQVDQEILPTLREDSSFEAVATVTEDDLKNVYHLDEHLFVLRVARGAALEGTTIGDNRIGDAFDFRLLALFREGKLIESPRSEEVIQAGDLFLLQGQEQDMDVLRGLQQIEKLDDMTPYLAVFEQGQLEMLEAAIHPHARLNGRSVADLKLRERYEVEVAAVWRDGEPIRSGIPGLELKRGDALLIVGPRRRLAELSADPDLIVLKPVQVKPIDKRKAPLAAGLMAVAILSVLLGYLPIHIAAISAAALMVATRCLNMEQAYRAIEWQAIFLIAGMLPLGVAMHQTGAAEYLAGGVIALLGPYGPWPVLAGLYAVTAIGTLIIPTAALVLLMAPIALSASADLGIEPVTAIMAVAIAASASLASPVSHPANVLVMGPGGYRFLDYLKLGLPLTLVVFAVTFLLLPLVWPIH